CAVCALTSELIITTNVERSTRILRPRISQTPDIYSCGISSTNSTDHVSMLAISGSAWSAVG
ncbi:MAG: hypothetical protein ACI87W_001567, partial [Halieaceae bacterium]